MIKDLLRNPIKFVVTALLICSSVISIAQITDEEIDKIIEQGSSSKLISTNSELLLNGKFKQAARVAKKLVQLDSENANYNYRLGYALLQFSPDINEPIPYLRKASLKAADKYDASSEKESNAPVDALYYYGWSLHRVGKIDEAVVAYTQFNERAGKKNVLRGYAELKLTQCENAKQLLGQPTNDKLINLGAINSEDPEYSAVIAIDGSALYFTSRRHWIDSSGAVNLIDPKTDNYLEDMYISFLDFDEEWTEPVRMDLCQPDQNEATLSVSIDERRIYVYSDISGNGDIYYTDYARGKFNEISKLDIPGINTDDWEPHIMVSPDGEKIFFVSEREGGFGGRDIYMISKLPDGSWSKTKNLGETINTPFDEDAPFLSIDNKTLYFASNGPKSMGGFDLFVSILGEDGEFSEPINMGSPVNSPGDDAFYTTTADGYKGYITSFREGGKGDLDLYEIEHFPPRGSQIAMLKGQIFVVNNDPLPEDISIKVKCLNCDGAPTVEIFPRLRDGVFSTKLEKCKEYELTYTYNKGKTEFHKSTLSTDCLPEYEEIYNPVYLRLSDTTIVPYYSLNIKTIDEASRDVVGNVKVEILDENGNVLETAYTDDKGNYLSELLREKALNEKVNLKFRVSKDGYLTKTIDLDLNLGAQNGVPADLYLEKASIGDDLGKLLKLDPIYFDLNSSFLRKDAKAQLQKVIDAMNNNPNMVIECGSHTDCRASKEYNDWLSQRRAERTVNYIKKRISNPSRISGKGYGETKLVNDCECEGDQVSDCSEEQHQLNRRTEFLIIKN